MRVLTQFPEGSRQTNAKRGKSGVRSYLIATVVYLHTGRGGTASRTDISNKGTLLQRERAREKQPLRADGETRLHGEVIFPEAGGEEAPTQTRDHNTHTLYYTGDLMIHAPYITPPS